MISLNESNTAWFGKPVGLLTEPAWFAKSSVEKREELEKFEWIEFKCPLDAAPSSMLLHQEGFFWADVTISFRVALTGLQSSPSLDRYKCLSAEEQPFRITASIIKHFSNERFLMLPGMTPHRLNDRYANWANELIEQQPSRCLQITLDGKVQGWFVGSAEGSMVNLTLAMLANDAGSPGAHLYHKAVLTYAAQGFVLGKAAFSVRNTPVLNIYSKLGAQFMRPQGIWIWCRY